MKGVIIRKIIFFGFLKVKIKFLQISKPACPKNPNGFAVFTLLTSLYLGTSGY